MRMMIVCQYILFYFILNFWVTTNTNIILDTKDYILTLKYNISLINKVRYSDIQAHPMNKIDIRMKSVFIDTNLFIQALDSSRVRPQQVAREIRKKVGYGNHGNGSDCLFRFSTLQDFSFRHHVLLFMVNGIPGFHVECGT